MRTLKAETGIAATQQSYLPDIGLVGGYTYQQGNAIFPEHNPYIGAALRWNITDLIGNHYEVAKNNLLKKQAEENELYNQKQTLSAVETAYRKINQAQELIIVAEKVVAYRTKELKLENDRIAAGLSTKLKVLETEAALAKAEADLYAAKQSYKVALAELNLLTNVIN